MATELGQSENGDLSCRQMASRFKPAPTASGFGVSSNATRTAQSATDGG
jgi:hypothetical protein